MTIDELIELAQDARDNLGGDAQVRIACRRPAERRHVRVARHRRPPGRRESLRPRVGLARLLLPDRGTATGVPGGHLASSQRAVTGVRALAARLRDDHGCPVFTGEYGGLPPRREHHARGVPVPGELEARNLRGKEGAAHAATKEEGPEPGGRLRSGAGRPSCACCYMPSHDAKAASESVRRRSWRVSTRTVSRTWGW